MESPTAAAPSRVRYRVLAWMCVIAAIAYLQRNSFAVVKGPLSDDLALDPGVLGKMAALFYAGYAIFQIPGGLLRDYWGTRLTLTVVVLVGSLAMALMAVSNDLRLVMAAWLALGACQAALFPCAISAIRHWFPPTQRATASGILAACMPLGGAISTALGAAMLEFMSWRAVIGWFALPAALWAGAFAFCYRSRPEWHPGVNDAELSLIHSGEPPRDDTRATIADTVHGPTPWLTILLTPSLVFLYLQQFCRAAGQVFYGTWFNTYLQEERAVSATASGWLTSLPQLALMLGALAGGFVTDYLLRRLNNPRLAYQGVAIVSLMICALLIGASYFVADAVQAVIVISIGQFFGSLAGPAAYAVSIAKGGRHLSTVFSTMNMSGNLGAMIMPWLVPELVERTGWNMALGLFAGLFAVAALCWLPIRPQGAIDERS